MNEKLKLKYLMLYPEAKVQCYGEKINYTVSFIDKVNERVWLRTKPFAVGNDRDDIAIEDCKLILRPIVELSEDEDCLHKSLQVIHQNENGDVYYYDSIDSIDYLRSINIDIDGLQERGLCIYE